MPDVVACAEDQSILDHLMRPLHGLLISVVSESCSVYDTQRKTLHSGNRAITVSLSSHRSVIQTPVLTQMLDSGIRRWLSGVCFFVCLCFYCHQ